MKPAIFVLFLGGCAQGGAAMLVVDAGSGTGGSGAAGGAGGSVQRQASELYASGSRIKMRAGRTADGAAQFLGWRDTQRNENCSFRVFAGQLRCVPDFLFITPNGYYADAACSVPAAPASATACQQPGYVGTTDTCGMATHIYITGAVSAAYLKAGTSCVAAAPTMAVAAGAEVDPASFAAVTESVE